MAEALAFISATAGEPFTARLTAKALPVPPVACCGRNDVMPYPISLENVGSEVKTEKNITAKLRSAIPLSYD